MKTCLPSWTTCEYVQPPCQHLGHLPLSLTSRYKQEALTRQQKLLNEISAIRKPFVQPPPEILYMIFQRTIPPSYLLDSSTAPGPDSLACKVLRQQKALVGVCRTWHTIASPFLYDDIYIRRAGQLPALLRALEGGQTNFGDHVQKLTIYCLIPQQYSDQFHQDINRVFHLCPRLTSFAYTSPCRLPTLNLPSLKPALTHLKFSDAIQHDALTAALMEVCSELVSLSFQVPGTTASVIMDPSLRLPRLEYLHCGITAVTKTYLVVVEQWSMPKLGGLTFKLNGNPVSWSGDLIASCLVSFCRAHGKGLTFLHIHPEYWWSMAKFTIAVQPLLDLCPALEHIVLHPRTAPPLTHPKIKWIDIWEPHVREVCVEEWTTVHLSLTQQAFPSLRGVRTLGAAMAALTDLPTNIPPNLVLDVADAFECKFLDLLVRHDPGSLLCIEPEWPEDASDSEEDADFVYCSEDDLVHMDGTVSDGSSLTWLESDSEADSDTYIERHWDAGVET